MGSYTPQTWVNGSGGGTPVSATRLTTMETGIGGAFTTPRPVFVQVISSEAPSWMKDGADSSGTTGAWLCDGIADQLQINGAVQAATGSGNPGRVQLSGGAFNCNDSVLIDSAVDFTGCGWNTRLKAVSITSSAAGFGSGVGLIKANAVTSHAYHIRDMFLDGNFAAGGSCSGIWLTSSNTSNDASTFPDTNPDPDVSISNLLMTNFAGSASRNGIVMDTDMRGSMISNMQMRNFTGHGIWFVSSPDSHINMVHMGTVTGNGYYIQGGNVKLTQCKAFYCDDAGFRITSGRGSLSACESQDNNIGAVFASEPAVCTSFVVDTAQSDGIILSSSGYSLIGCQIFNRGNGRYTTTARGLTFSATLSDMMVLADVSPANITTPLSNGAGITAGSRNFARINVESGTPTTVG